MKFEPMQFAYLFGFSGCLFRSQAFNGFADAAFVVWTAVQFVGDEANAGKAKPLF